ncbi:MAG: dephospho-CoA kinase [Bdellovibrionales bacterium]|nr:dephospho-CoA kinase [Bdellovibrionales bacterium]
MKWIGLTGGIASGKSTAARILREMGHSVVDADALARLVVAKNGPAYREVLSVFGPDFVDGNGDLDRKKLGQIVFADKKKRVQLEQIVHPKVKSLALLEKSRLETEGKNIAFYDVPLLYEKNLEAEFDAVLLIYAPESIQIERMMIRNGYSESEARERMQAQIPIEQKLLRSPHVVMNTGKIEDLKMEIKKILGEIGS